RPARVPGTGRPAVNRTPPDAMPCNVRIGARRQPAVPLRRTRGRGPTRPATGRSKTVHQPHGAPHGPPTRDLAHRILTRPRPPVGRVQNIRRPRTRWTP